MVTKTTLFCDGCGDIIDEGKAHLSIVLSDLYYKWEADWCDTCASKVGPFLKDMGIRKREPEGG